VDEPLAYPDPGEPGPEQAKENAFPAPAVSARNVNRKAPEMSAVRLTTNGGVVFRASGHAIRRKRHSREFAGGVQRL